MWTIHASLEKASVKVIIKTKVFVLMGHNGRFRVITIVHFNGFQLQLLTLMIWLLLLKEINLLSLCVSFYL